MATTLQSGNVTSLNTTERTTLVFEPLLRSTLEYGSYQLMPNVRTEAKIAYLRDMEEILQRNTGCGFTPRGSNTIYDRTIRVKPFKAEIQLCMTDLKNTILQDQLGTSASGKYAWSNLQSFVGKYTIEAMKRAIQSDIFRLFWFGDEASTDPFYRQLNGLWGHYIPELISAGQLTPVDAKSGQPLASGDGEGILKAMYNAQSKELRSLENSQKQFLVSSDLWDQYMSDLEDTGGGDAGRSQIIDGVNVLFYRGIRLVEQPLWDTLVTRSTGQTLPKRAVLTVPKNLIIGTNMLSDFNSIEMWIDRREQVSCARVCFDLGANYMHPSLMVVAQ